MSPRATTGASFGIAQMLDAISLERSQGATAPIGNANVPVGFVRHVSRAEEDLGVPEKAVQTKGLSFTTKSTNFYEWGAASPENFGFGFIRVH